MLFSFSKIGEVMLTPYDFSTITGLKMGGERIAINDSILSMEIRGLLGVIPPKVKSKNIPLMWLYSNIDKCETIATSTHMFMLLLYWIFLMSELGEHCEFTLLVEFKGY